ncbi:NAD-dependent epimerase/dehydratase family protein [Pontivivens insulae]|uniref:GDP-6-deoxy-D-mannose reductase n=1 Tax=Pontivivens insulae TaxID=1639689 RepID=A0A2R8A823_9RHOB|nr:SDR family oxidoreductase [Pontivivens insulae]RED18272.1 UDP-glucose 4-epimerase [Pontivivens insulae]SPF28170.1 GDP-6-deoxy-D-mannose reductase [Pontivivens insulae]
MPKVVITGATGLLGGRLAEFLNASGRFDVIRTSRKARTGFHRFDLSAQEMHADVLNGVDWVVHAAGMNAAACAKDPSLAAETNGAETAALAQLAARNGVSGFTFLSTAHVYDAPLCGHLDETFPPRNEHPYATSNLLGETGLLGVAEKTELTAQIIRLSNGFGAPVDPKADCWMLVLNDIARQIAERGEARLQSSGEQLRDFVAITNICEALSHLIQATTPGVFNVASGQAQPVRTLVDQLVGIASRDLGREVALTTAPLTGEPQPDLTLDTSRLRATGAPVPDAASTQAELERLWSFCRREFEGNSS